MGLGAGIGMTARRGGRGPNLIANGAFGADLSSWTASANGGTGSVVWSAGAAVLTGDGALLATLAQGFATVPGARYELAFDVATSAAGVLVGTAAQNGSVLNPGAQSVGTGRTLTFTASGATTWVTFTKLAAQACAVDNVSVRQVF